MAIETLEFDIITELKLGLPTSDKNEKKRVFSEMEGEENNVMNDRKMQTKVAVGWPPVCMYRKKNSFNEKNMDERSKMYVKVSMDGVPYLRKIDLSMHEGYFDFSSGLEKLFGIFGMKNEFSEFVSIYEDKDGDWMLMGDVPWEMFIESCKRLRVMKKSDAKGFGLHP